MICLISRYVKIIGVDDIKKLLDSFLKNIPKLNFIRMSLAVMENLNLNINLIKNQVRKNHGLF